MPTEAETETETEAPRKVRQNHLHGRRWCGVCGTELPAYEGRGRPALYCQASSGRPCFKLVKTTATFRAHMEEVAQALPPNKREAFLHSMRGTLRQMSQDLTRTVAQLNGDKVRDSEVGKRDPDGFYGD